MIPRLSLAACLALAMAAPARGHQQWANGEPVPAWVKSSCCGPDDAHLLRADRVHLRADGVHIDGINTVVPYERVLPSPDGRIWGFWNPAVGVDAPVYCLFFSGSI